MGVRHADCDKIKLHFTGNQKLFIADQTACYYSRLSPRRALWFDLAIDIYECFYNRARIREWRRRRKTGRDELRWSNRLRMCSDERSAEHLIRCYCSQRHEPRLRIKCSWLRSASRHFAFAELSSPRYNNWSRFVCTARGKTTRHVHVVEVKDKNFARLLFVFAICPSILETEFQ